MPGAKYSAEVKAQAVRLVQEQKNDYGSESKAISAVARQLGIGSAATVRQWCRTAAAGAGRRDGTASAGADEVRALQQKVAELEATISMLRETTRFFIQESADTGPVMGDQGQGRAEGGSRGRR